MLVKWEEKKSYLSKQDYSSTYVACQLNSDNLALTDTKALLTLLNIRHDPSTSFPLLKIEKKDQFIYFSIHNISWRIISLSMEIHGALFREFIESMNPKKPSPACVIISKTHLAHYLRKVVVANKKAKDKTIKEDRLAQYFWSGF